MEKELEEMMESAEKLIKAYKKRQAEKEDFMLSCVEEPKPDTTRDLPNNKADGTINDGTDTITPSSGRYCSICGKPISEAQGMYCGAGYCENQKSPSSDKDRLKELKEEFDMNVDCENLEFCWDNGTLWEWILSHAREFGGLI